MVEKRAGYAYTNTRVRVMKSLLLLPSDFEKLSKMSSAEIARFLGESNYRREINEMGAIYSGAELLEYALNRNLANTFKKVLGFSVRDAKEHISLYLERFDYWNVKTIMRGKFSNAADEEIFNALIPAGKLSEEFLEKVIKESRNVDEAVEAFKHTHFYGILKEFKENLSELEDQLDINYYERVLPLASPELREFLQKEIDTLNTLNFERSKRAEIKFKAIPGGKIVKFKPREKESIEDIGLEFRKRLAVESRRLLHRFKRSVAPVLGFLSAKELEVKNLRILVRGKHAKLPLELVGKQLVF